MTNIQPIDLKKHQTIRVQKTYSYDHAKLAQYMPINANEFSQASSNYPIFFIKDKTTAKLFPVALFGFEDGQNLFYTQDRWQATYIPEVMQLSPFSMGNIQDTQSATSEQNWVACIDEDSEYLSTTDGEFVIENGKATDYFLKIQNDLKQFFGYKQPTMVFIERLLELNLIKPVQFNLIYDTVDEGSSKRVLQGMYTIDEQAISQLTPEIVQEFYTAGYFSCIYSMLNSQHNIYSLIRRQQETGVGKVVKALQLTDNK